VLRVTKTQAAVARTLKKTDVQRVSGLLLWHRVWHRALGVPAAAGKAEIKNATEKNGLYPVRGGQECCLCCQHVNRGRATPTGYPKIQEDSNLRTE
jgi:hypothetical protein